VPPPHPAEFRRRAIELARERAKPIAQIACGVHLFRSLRSPASLQIPWIAAPHRHAEG
jgi:hypothetical protein